MRIVKLLSNLAHDIRLDIYILKTLSALNYANGRQRPCCALYCRYLINKILIFDRYSGVGSSMRLLKPAIYIVLYSCFSPVGCEVL